MSLQKSEVVIPKSNRMHFSSSPGMSTPHSFPRQCSFLDLPRDIRDRVYELIFFAEEKTESGGLYQAICAFELRKLNWASTGLVGATGNQIHPYRRDSKYQPHYDLAVLRTNHQIQDEAERVFYGWSSFNLTSDAFAPGEVPTFQFFQSLPPRYRKLIRRVEIRCFYRSAHHSQTGNFRPMSLFDWKAFMKFLALECPSLRSMILWGFADGVEGEDMDRSCRVSADWVQSILQIKTLRFFDIRAIPRRKIIEDQSCVPQVLQDLRTLLYQQSSALKTAPAEPLSSSLGSTFPLLQLPLHLRKRIYRFALLPVDKHLHPYLKSWYDVTTRNVVPLFLTCRQIQKEAEAVLYGEGVFCAPEHKYDKSLSNFLQNLSPRLLRQINHKVTYRQMLSPFIDHALTHTPLNFFEFTRKTSDSNPSQRHMFIAENLYKPWPLKGIVIETDDLNSLSQQMRDWITQGFVDLGSSDDDHLIFRLDW